MKRILTVLLCLIIITSVLSSCANGDGVKSEYPKVVATSHVVADWVWNIMSGAYDVFQIDLLADEGKDMHNFQPSAADMRIIATADLVIYIGGESDKWIEAAMASVDSRAKAIRLMDVVDLHSAEHHGDHDHGADEHIWLSFENAIKSVEVISDAVSELDVNKAETFKSNENEYTEKLNLLYDEYRTAVLSAEYDTLVFADRFPFIYLIEELGLEYAAAFPGCSSETTASFETVVSLARTVDEKHLPCVIVLENSEGIAKTVIENTASKNAQILALDSMQVMSGQDFDYIETMASNLEVLKNALGCE